MQLASHHRPALAGAVGLSSLALFDAVTRGVTGSGSVFSDGSDVRWLAVAGSIVHGLAYVALAHVVRAERERIAVNRAARLAVRVLTPALSVLGVGFLVLWPLADLILTPVEAAVSGVIGVAFGLHFLGALVLGLATARRPGGRPGSLVLASLLPVIGITALLGLLAPGFVHPAYAETTVCFGLALLGAGNRRRENAPERARSAIHP
jgi:hypothetical protein